MELMADPVVVATGHTYDRACIERWLGAGHGTCPATGARLRHLELTPNFALRDAVAEWALRAGVPVPQPEDGGGRTAAALLYKGGGGGGGIEEGLGGSARSSGGGGESGGSSRRRAAAAAAAVSRFAAAEEEEAAAAEEDEDQDEGEAPRRRRQQQATAATEAEANSSSPLLLPPTILRGHDEIVWAVEASKGRLFSASADRSVRVWDVASRRCEAVLEDHARPVLCLALAPASDAVVEGGERASASSSGGGEEKKAEGSGDEESSEAAGDDDLLFSGSYDFTIKVWSLRTLSRVKTLTGHGDAVRSLLYVPPKKKREATAAAANNNNTNSLSLLGQRGRLFSASYDGTVRVWDVATLAAVATLPGHSGPVRTLASVDGLVFSGSYDKTVREEMRGGGIETYFLSFSSSFSKKKTRRRLFFSFHLTFFNSKQQKTFHTLSPDPRLARRHAQPRGLPHGPHRRGQGAGGRRQVEHRRLFFDDDNNGRNGGSNLNSSSSPGPPALLRVRRRHRPRLVPPHAHLRRHPAGPRGQRPRARCHDDNGNSDDGDAASALFGFLGPDRPRLVPPDPKVRPRPPRARRGRAGAGGRAEVRGERQLRRERAAVGPVRDRRRRRRERGRRVSGGGSRRRRRRRTRKLDSSSFVFSSSSPAASLAGLRRPRRRRPRARRRRRGARLQRVLRWKRRHLERGRVCLTLSFFNLFFPTLFFTPFSKKNRDKRKLPHAASESFRACLPF